MSDADLWRKAICSKTRQCAINLQGTAFTLDNPHLMKKGRMVTIVWNDDKTANQIKSMSAHNGSAAMRQYASATERLEQIPDAIERLENEKTMLLELKQDLRDKWGITESKTLEPVPIFDDSLPF